MKIIKMLLTAALMMAHLPFFWEFAQLSLESAYSIKLGS